MNSVTHSETFDIEIPLEQAFPLFSPEGEKAWVPGWDYENLMGTTELCEDHVFRTKTHDHAATEAIWIVKKYDSESHVVEFYKIEPKEKIGVITVSCVEVGVGSTTVCVTYRYIALSEAGEDFIASFTKDHYKDFIAEWQSLLLKYKETTQPTERYGVPPPVSGTVCAKERTIS